MTLTLYCHRVDGSIYPRSTSHSFFRYHYCRTGGIHDTAIVNDVLSAFFNQAQRLLTRKSTSVSYLVYFGSHCGLSRTQLTALVLDSNNNTITITFSLDEFSIHDTSNAEGLSTFIPSFRQSLVSFGLIFSPTPLGFIILYLS